MSNYQMKIMKKESATSKESNVWHPRCSKELGTTNLDVMESNQLVTGKISTCVFYNKEKQIRVVVHGDDFTVAGPEESLDWFRTMISKRFEVKF